MWLNATWAASPHAVFFVVAQNGKRRRKQRKGGSAVSLVIHLARWG